jgi:hypothetical protein
VSSEGVSERGPNALTGFSIVLTDIMDAALEIAQRIEGGPEGTCLAKDEGCVAGEASH